MAGGGKGSCGVREFRYSLRRLRGDYLRAATGLAITVPPLVFAKPGPVAVAILGTLALLFAYLALRNARRHASRFVLTDDGLRRGRDAIAWTDLDRLRLRHFGKRRDDPGRGWMEMRLAAPGGRITLDTELDGFLAIARAAHHAAVTCGLVLDGATRANFRALGLETPDPLKRPAAPGVQGPSR